MPILLLIVISRGARDDTHVDFSRNPTRWIFFWPCAHGRLIDLEINFLRVQLHLHEEGYPRKTVKRRSPRAAEPARSRGRRGSSQISPFAESAARISRECKKSDYETSRARMSSITISARQARKHKSETRVGKIHFLLQQKRGYTPYSVIPLNWYLSAEVTLLRISVPLVTPFSTTVRSARSLARRVFRFGGSRPFWLTVPIGKRSPLDPSRKYDESNKLTLRVNDKYFSNTVSSP